MTNAEQVAAKLKENGKSWEEQDLGKDILMAMFPIYSKTAFDNVARRRPEGDRTLQLIKEAFEKL